MYGTFLFLDFANLITAVSFRNEDIQVYWKLYIEAKFYADYEYAIFFISKVNFTRVIMFPKTPQMYGYRRTFR